MAKNATKKTKITLEGIRHNQKYLARWDQYQIDWLNSVKLQPQRPILMPIALDIKDQKIERSLISNTDIQKLAALKDAPKDIYFKDAAYDLDEIFEHYAAGMASAKVNPRPPHGLPALSKRKSPLDLNNSCPVLLLFTLPDGDITFNEKMAYSIDNFEGDPYGRAVEVIKTFNAGKALCVLNHNWTPACGKNYRLKYNLHLTIKQTVDGADMFTDITIDPGGNNDQAGRGNP